MVGNRGDVRRDGAKLLEDTGQRRGDGRASRLYVATNEKPNDDTNEHTNVLTNVVTQSTSRRDLTSYTVSIPSFLRHSREIREKRHLGKFSKELKA